MSSLGPTQMRVTANALRETASPQMLALEELEFRKIFMIFAYLSGNKIEDVLPEDYEDYIKSLKDLPMADFESQIWNQFGHKYIAASDRAKNLDSDPTTTNIYHCNVEIREDSVVKIFKGPYVENTRTHLQNSVGDDNVLVVKFMEKDTKTHVDIYRQHYHKVAEDGIVLGLRRYRFFIYKDGGKKESFVRCYFIRTESGWNMDEPYILSGRTIGQARKLFMHIHTAPTLAKYMARFALILSKTITLDDLSTVDVSQIDDVPCKDEYGNIVLNRDDEPLIHTDGTGLISQDLALTCPTSIFKGNFLKSHDAAACGALTGSKRRRSHITEHPLLIQFRMFFNGSAVKGTALVDRRLPPRTILIRPSMIKIKTDPKLSGAQSFNSLEIVSTSNQPKRTSTSRFLIALLHYGGVKAEYFMELLQNAIEEAENTRYDYEDALKLAFGYADMKDSMSVRMILSGIPLEEAYLQHRLAFIAAQKERKKIKKGKLPIDDCFYLMGTTDPTGTLLPNEVCVILDNGQLSGDVLVYKHPGLHFGDIHVLTARYISNLEKVVGYSKYAILFPTSGKRSLADEMANSDFDGDMYWVSRNPKLLEHFKPHKPWVQVITPKKTQQKRPQDFDESQLERQLFDEFMKTRFTPSYAIGTAADCWLAYMDRLLTDEVDEIEKELIKNKMTKLVDKYYLALDAPKTGNKINIEDDLMIKQYPHFMDQKDSSYHSTSILGRIYDEANKLMLLQSENVRSIDISLLPYFTEREASEECNYRWKRRYDEYLGDSKLLIDLPDKEEKDTKFEELYRKYKHMLYNAAEFEQTGRNLDDVFTEACAIYRIVYEKAMANKDIRKCCFAWKVAGHALCRFYALENEDDTALCSLPVLGKILKKAPR